MLQFDKRKLLYYQLTVLFSVIFSLMGFSYNVWRMEISEQNNTIRTASFEIMVNLSSLEQLVYAAHYDKDLEQGNPRKGWVLVGLIKDLSELTDDNVIRAAQKLHQVWHQNWDKMPHDRAAVDLIISTIEAQRTDLQRLLRTLE